MKSVAPNAWAISHESVIVTTTRNSVQSAFELCWTAKIEQCAVNVADRWHFFSFIRVPLVSINRHDVILQFLGSHALHNNIPKAALVLGRGYECCLRDRRD